MFKHAIVRRPGRDLGAGITTSNLGAPDYDLVLRQHAAYVRALEDLGLEVTVLDPLEGFPDAYFVEDAAVVLPDVAVVTRPGAEARRGESDAMAAVLNGCRDLVRIEPPGTLDGGDVLLAGRRAFIGISGRTNDEGAKQLGAVLESDGLDWTAVRVARGLHLKSSVNHLGGEALLLTQEFSQNEAFEAFQRIVLDPAEAYAANTLWVNGTLLTPAGYPGVRAKIETLGLPVVELDMSEARRMDGGLSCLSLRF